MGCKCSKHCKHNSGTHPTICGDVNSTGSHGVPTTAGISDMYGCAHCESSEANGCLCICMCSVASYHPGVLPKIVQHIVSCHFDIGHHRHTIQWHGHTPYIGVVGSGVSTCWSYTMVVFVIDLARHWLRHGHLNYHTCLPHVGFGLVCV